MPRLLAPDAAHYSRVIAVGSLKTFFAAAAAHDDNGFFQLNICKVDSLQWSMQILTHPQQGRDLHI
jgi:hypothetical protein